MSSLVFAYSLSITQAQDSLNYLMYIAQCVELGSTTIFIFNCSQQTQLERVTIHYALCWHSSYSLYDCLKYQL
ncbi:hypothetical protein EDC96DRAFT_512995 [Choanephora cucurbitarum]|nr:hypothetical protein EDC96DRAFT_512995 [Choanephora cucurbitarum]